MNSGSGLFGSRLKIGILGGGQLGKMLAQAAHKFGFQTMVFTDAHGCACDVSPHIIAPYDDEDMLWQFFQDLDVVTLEFESIPLSVLDFLESLSDDEAPSFYPGRRALETSQNRASEKKMARRLGIKTPEFWIIERADDLSQVNAYPAIIKTATGGYDGKGQRRVASAKELGEAFESFGNVPCVAEEVVNFSHEISVILARDQDGEIVAYDPFENHHEGGILRTTRWPLGRTFCGTHRDDVIRQAVGMASQIASDLDIVGLLAVEMFVLKDGAVLFNEIAPRPHNSGHVTIECARTSQFEQHIRAVAGLPLGSPEAVCFGMMTNIIGSLDEAVHGSLENDPRKSFHWYGKGPKPGRKLGHIVEYDSIGMPGKPKARLVPRRESIGRVVKS